MKEKKVTHVHSALLQPETHRQEEALKPEEEENEV